MAARQGAAGFCVVLNRRRETKMSDCVMIQDLAGVRTITVNRPAQRNALNAAVIVALEDAIDDAANSHAVRALVLTGAGEESFVAGADIAEMMDASPEYAERIARAAARVHGRLRGCGKPSIAAVNGYCMGGGLELAIACDIRIAAKSAIFALPEIRLGIIPGAGGATRLARIIGDGPARALCLTGLQIDAARAYALGLVTELAEPAELKGLAQKRAVEIAAFSATALAQLKGILDRSADCDLAAAEALEQKAFALCFASPDQHEGMTAFLEKRKPRFR